MDGSFRHHSTTITYTVKHVSTVVRLTSQASIKATIPLYLSITVLQGSHEGMTHVVKADY